MNTEILAQRKKLKVLIIRTDRIGDVVLSTPVLTSIRKAKPEWEISLLVKPLLSDLLLGHPDIDRLITLDTNDKPGFMNTQMLHETLKAEQFDLAIHLFSDFWISLAVWRAGIPCSIGPASKFAQIFYTNKIRQRRSKGNRHETDYNLDLLKPLGIEPVRKSSLPSTENIRPEALALLDSSRKNIGIFPGMGGSARNWKPEKYAQLADKLSADGFNIILVAGPGEEPLLDELLRRSSGIYPKVTNLGLKEFAGFISKLNLFIAPSTGPLHISSAVGTPAVGIYCPIRVCLPLRWGPIGEKDIGIVPDVPVCEKCDMERCKEYDCMDKLDVDTVYKAILERI